MSFKRLIGSYTCVMAVQSRDVMSGLTGSFSYASDCFINAIALASPPVVTNASYRCNLFELKCMVTSIRQHCEYIIMEYIVVESLQM